MDDNVIPIIAIIAIFGLPIGGWITIRVLQHRERMEMLRRGLVPPAGWHRNRGPWAAGPGAPIGPPMPDYAAYEDRDSAQCTMRAGIKTTMVGLALLIGLSFIGYHGGDGPLSTGTIRPGPWLLGGLIPMFVGIAQIIIALMSGAVFAFRVPPASGPSGPPRPGQRPYGSAQPGPPGPRYEELARPAPPPDRQ